MRLLQRPQTRTAAPPQMSSDAISAEVARLNRLTDRDLSTNGIDRVTLGAHVLKALHAL